MQRGIAGYQGEIAVAVKTLTSRDPEMVAKFMEEAELMKKFTHPNIVSLLGGLYLVHSVIFIHLVVAWLSGVLVCRYQYK